LLKGKSDALKIRFKAIFFKLVENKENLDNTMRDAFFFLAVAKHTTGDPITSTVLENVSVAEVQVKIATDNTVGVHLPLLSKDLDGASKSEKLIGLSKGRQQILKSRGTYLKAVDALIELASLQVTFFALDEAIHITNRRVHAIEYVLKPLLENTLRYIVTEMDEDFRQESYRIMKVQRNKIRDMTARAQGAHSQS